MYRGPLGLLINRCLETPRDYNPDNWSKKLMKFTYKGKRISLQGLTTELAKCSNISGENFQGLLNRRAITHMIQMQVKDPILLTCNSVEVAILQETPIPIEIQKLIDGYQDVFQTPTALPPPSPFDHSI